MLALRSSISVVSLLVEWLFSSNEILKSIGSCSYRLCKLTRQGDTEMLLLKKSVLVSFSVALLFQSGPLLVANCQQVGMLVTKMILQM